MVLSSSYSYTTLLLQLTTVSLYNLLISLGACIHTKVLLGISFVLSMKRFYFSIWLVQQVNKTASSLFIATQTKKWGTGVLILLLLNLYIFFWFLLLE
jgi:hypothetical protein